MFSILLVEHPLWKYTLKPCILSQKEDGKLTIDQMLSSQNKGEYQLQTFEEKLVAYSDSITEASLMKSFIREKMMVMDFQKNFFSLPHHDLIISSIEKTLYKMSLLLQEHQVPLYFKQKSYLNIYPSDKIETSRKPCETHPHFIYNGESIDYSLQIVVDGERQQIPILAPKTQVVQLSSEPCAFVLNHFLYIFENTSFKKISAFFTKRSVTVPQPNVDTYFKGFVAKSILSENVSATGFSIIEERYETHPIITLQEDLSLVAALKLSFRYGNTEVDENTTKERFISVDDDYTFHHFSRDRALEQKYADQLLGLGLRKFGELYYRSKPKEGNSDTLNIIQFLIEHKEDLNQFDLIQNLRDHHFLIEPMKLDLQLQQHDIDWFEMKGTIHIAGFDIPFHKIRENLIEGNPILELPDNTHAVIPSEWFESYSDIVRFCSGKENEHLYIHRHHHGLLEDVFTEEKRVHLTQSEECVVPDSVQAELRPYQKIGYSWLVALYNQKLGGCLADDMGLGKTLQFLAFLRHIYPITKISGNTETCEWPYATETPSLFDQPVITQPVIKQREERKKAASLVILPTSLLFNWVNEKNKFTPSLTHLVYAGEGRIKSKQIGKIFDHYHVIFTTYGVVRNDIDYLKEYNFECVIADESQNLKNSTSQAFRSIIELKCNHFFCMTGTPIENHLDDLWSQMHLANRNLLGSQNYFKKFFVTPITKQQDETRAGLLQRMIKPFILRRTKQEVATDLPEKTEQTILCTLSEEHKKLYDKEKLVISNHIMGMIQNQTIHQNSVVALSALTRLRQLANHPRLLEETSTIPSSKMEEILERLISLKEEKHKVLIFSSFVKHLELLETEIQQLGYRYSKLTGETQDRQKEVERFQNDDETFCFLISIKAGGVGLNLTQADYVFLMDPWWNPAAESQAVDRAYRIGQKRNVFVYRFIMKETVEEKIQLLQAQKKEIADLFINSNNPFEEINWEEIFGKE